jgi:hypothetical protein
MHLKVPKATKAAANAERKAVEERYRALFKRRERSGETLKALAASSGVPVGTLAWWGHELRRRDRERTAEHTPQGPTFLPVRIAAAANEPIAQRSRPPSPYAIVLGGGRTLIVPAGFDAEAVTVLVRAVEAAPC